VFAIEADDEAPLAIDVDGHAWRPAAWNDARRLWASDALTAWRDDAGALFDSASCSASARAFVPSDAHDLGEVLAWYRGDARVLLANVHGAAIEIHERREERR
jgi:hypothetical protein